jgi:lysophospholipase L1-like esterase
MLTTVLLWLQYLVSFALLPIILPLRYHLRKTIARLPEAPGPRTGILGSSTTPIRLLSIGESPMAGVGLQHQEQNLLLTVANQIQEQSKDTVEWTICAKNGIRMREILPKLSKNFPTKADILFIAMGVNDCKEMTPVKEWIAQWNGLLHHLRERYPTATIICSSCPPMDCFPALPVPVQIFLGARANLMNHVLETQIRSFEQVYYLPIPTILEPKYFSQDGFHPNAFAHERWGTELCKAIWKWHQFGQSLD